MPGPDQHRPGPGPAPTGPTKDSKPAPIGPGSDRSKPATPAQPAQAPPKTLAQIARQPSNAPNPPVESKPTAEEVKAEAKTLNSNGAAQAAKPAPTGPKNNRPMPVIPLTGPTKPFFTPSSVEEKAGKTSVKATVQAGSGSVQDATNAARAAVAVAMAQLGNSNANHGGNAMDNLTSKVNEMRVNAVRGGPTGRGRGRGGPGGERRPGTKVEVPDSDFDFAQSNAKFSKESVVKEAAGGSPTVETPEASATEDPEATGPPAYNKTSSFFDNISSESKERQSNNGQKPGGREWRGEEQRRNMETFGQGSVDGSGYRNFRGRGRGRGRGTRGRGYGRGGNQQFQSTPAGQ